jgi:membrane associated rhomboid family serine protease
LNGGRPGGGPFHPIFVAMRSELLTLTNIILAITVAISAYGFQNEDFFKRWLFSPYVIARRKEYLRFLTSGFLHGGWMHLIFNMFTLYFFGHNVEQVFQMVHGQVMGSVYYLLLYLGAIVVADLPSYRRYRDASFYSAIGASGGVSAVIFASIMYFPTQSIYLYGALPIPGFIWGFVYVIFSYQFDRQGRNDGIGHSAHLYGSLFGLALTVVLNPPVISHFVDQLRNWKLF